MKLRVLLIVIVSLFLGAVIGTQLIGVSGRQEPASHTGLTIEQVHAMSCLVTSQVDVADIMETRVEETRVEGFTGGVRMAIIVKGDFLLGTDLSQAKFVSVDEDNRSVVLMLPCPKTQSPRLNHDGTKVYRITETGLWLITPGDSQTIATLLNCAYREAQQFVIHAGKQPDLVLRAKQQAQQVLETFFTAVGWKITIQWEP